MSHSSWNNQQSIQALVQKYGRQELEEPGASQAVTAQTFRLLLACYPALPVENGSARDTSEPPLDRRDASTQ